jgi:hypothetical protein
MGCRRSARRLELQCDATRSAGIEHTIKELGSKALFSGNPNRRAPCSRHSSSSQRCCSWRRRFQLTETVPVEFDNEPRQGLSSLGFGPKDGTRPSLLSNPRLRMRSWVGRGTPWARCKAAAMHGRGAERHDARQVGAQHVAGGILVGGHISANLVRDFQEAVS